MPYPLDGYRRPILSQLDYTHKLVYGTLTADGAQYSAEVTTTTINVDVEIWKVMVDPKISGNILWVQFSLTAALKAVSSATADLIWKWQARNKDGTWVDLHGAVTEANIGTNYVEKFMGGHFGIVANFNKVPFEVRLLLQCNEANEGRGKVKEISYVRVAYVVS